jgi:hypothetical protein
MYQSGRYHYMRGLDTVRYWGRHIAIDQYLTGSAMISMNESC